MSTGRRRRGRPPGTKNKRPPVEPDPTEFSCSVCDAVYGSRAALTAHQVTHTDAFDFECGQCNRVFGDYDTLTTHFFEVHVGGARGEVCLGSDKVVAQPFRLENVATENPNLSPVRTEEELNGTSECGQCDRTFGSVERLQTHFYAAHLGEGEDIPETPPHVPDEDSWDGGGGDFGGDDNEATEDPVVSEQFEEESVDAAPPPKPFQCGKCPKAYAYKSDLTIHLRTHTGERPYRCGECGKDFNVHRTLTVHLRRHNKAYRFFCEVVGCGKGFMTAVDRNRHEIRHVPIHLRPLDKVYKCSVCGKVFTQKVHMTKHMGYIHGNKERRYACELCGKRFQTMSCLKTHLMSIKHGGTGVSYKNKKKPKKVNPNPKKRGRKPKVRPPLEENSVESAEQRVGHVGGGAGLHGPVSMSIGGITSITLQDAFQIYGT